LLTKPTLGFKNFFSAETAITGIENIRIIQKGQIIGTNNKFSTFENFKMLMGA
jgi:putative transposase